MGLVVDDSRALAATPYHANFAVMPNPRRGIAVGGLGQPAAGRADADDRGGEHELRRAPVRIARSAPFSAFRICKMCDIYAPALA